jgi:hypothetical protein
MQAPFEADKTWLSTMALLSSASELRPAMVSSCVHAMYGDGRASTYAIRVLERCGQTSATLAWSDATSCCYGEQVWRLRVAKKAGVCALSGRAIATGDAVFRPTRLKSPPRNSEAMILATVMLAIPVGDSV